MTPADLIDVNALMESLRGMADGALNLAKSVGFGRVAAKAKGVTGRSGHDGGKESHTVAVDFACEADAMAFAAVVAAFMISDPGAAPADAIAAFVAAPLPGRAAGQTQPTTEDRT